MKGRIKKNQVVISALALMIALAGYLDFAGVEIGGEGENSTALSEGVVEDGKFYGDISSEDMDEVEEVSYIDSENSEEALDEVAKQEENSEDSDSSDSSDIESYDYDLTTADTENPGESVMASSDQVAESDVILEARLNREQVRSKNKEALMEVINNENIAEEQKDDAVATMVGYTQIAQKESAAEMLLEAKGYTDAVVSIGDETVDVMINQANIDDANRAQIEDIVTRKTGVSADKIVISSVQP